MSTIAHDLSTLPATVAASLLTSMWQGLLLTTCVAVCLRFVRGTTPAVRSRIWTAVLLVTVLLPMVSLAVPHVAVHGFHGVSAPGQWSLPLLALWIGLSVYRAIQLAQSALRLRGLLRRAVEIQPAAEIAKVLQSGSRKARLCLSQAVERPSVAGFFRPKVLLPPALAERLSAGDLEQVVLHEMEHLRRWDDWTNLLQQVCLVLLPLNPVLLWLDHQLCIERELACDDGVLRATRARKAYAACLVRLAEDSMVRRGVSLALAAVGIPKRESELAGRVRRILFERQASVSGKRLNAVTAGVLVGVLGLSAVLAGSPQLVRFSSAGSVVAQATTTALASPEVLSAAHSEAVRPTLVKVEAKQLGAPMLRKVSFTVPAHRLRRRPSRPARAFVPAGEQMPVWQPAQVLQKRFTLTSFEVSQPVYAAVPWQDGWLVVQL